MQVEQGSVIEGTVTSITKFGAFIEFGNKQTGMVHISEVSYGFIENISDVLTVGQSVKAMVMKIADDGKISLSIKRTQEKPDKRHTKKAPVAPPSRPTADAWSGNRNDNMSFEDMMNRFKQNSDDKMSDLKRKNGDNAKRTRRPSHKS